MNGAVQVATGWGLQGDLLVLDGLRLRLHRIGLSHWRAGTRLRSWAPAPLHRDDDGTLRVPCAAAEALWLGAWLDDEAASRAQLRLDDPDRGHGAAIALPAAFQLTALEDAQGAAHALTLAAGGQPVVLQLSLHCGAEHASIALRLEPPAAWAAASGRAAPAALHGPPPLPPRLG